MSARDVLEAYVQSWNAHDVDGTVSLYASQARRVSPLGVLEGREAIHIFLQDFFAMSPDTTIELGRIADAGDYVLFEFVDRGTQQGPLKTASGELPATGRAFQINGAAALRVVDERIVDERLYFDPAELLRELTR